MQVEDSLKLQDLVRYLNTYLGRSFFLETVRTYGGDVFAAGSRDRIGDAGDEEVQGEDGADHPVEGMLEG